MICLNPALHVQLWRSTKCFHSLIQIPAPNQAEERVVHLRLSVLEQLSYWVMVPPRTIPRLLAALVVSGPPLQETMIIIIGQREKNYHFQAPFLSGPWEAAWVAHACVWPSCLRALPHLVLATLCATDMA